MPVSENPLKPEWQEAEKIVYWIERTLLPTWKVSWNAKVRDKDTESTRQIDILLCKTEPHLLIRIIGEIRVHRTPQDVTWIEQVAQKVSSTEANGAFVVSSSGFTEPALKKCRALGIRALTLEQASNEEWSRLLTIQSIDVLERSISINVIPFDHVTGRPIRPSTCQLAQWSQKFAAYKGNASVGDLEASDSAIAQLVADLVNRAYERNCEHLQVEGVFPVEIAYKSKKLLPIQEENGAIRRAMDFSATVTFTVVISKYPIAMWRYASATGEVYAKYIQGRISLYGLPYCVEAVFPGGTAEIPAGSNITINVTPISRQAIEAFDGIEIPHRHESSGSEMSLDVMIRMKPRHQTFF